MTNSKILRGAHIITMDDHTGDLSSGDILIDGDTVREIAASITVEGAEIFDATGMIAIPGFVDTHRHTWQTAMRLSYSDVPSKRYFAEMLGPVGAAYTPDDVRIGNLLGAISALSAGTTTLLDWSHIQNSPENSDAAIEGLRQASGRAVFAHGWPMTADTRWIQNSQLGHPEDIRRLASTYFASRDQLLTLAMAARGPEMADTATWLSDLRLARELDIRTTVHVGAYAHNGAHRAVAQYAGSATIGPDMTFVHCGYSGLDELRMIADSGGTVSLGVQCELNADGIGDIPLDKLLSLGIRPSLSGDTETKCSGDMFTQMRMLYAHHRSWMGGGHSDPALSVPPLLTRDVLDFATMQGARAVGLESKIGSISPGKQADIVLIRATDLNLAPVVDPVAAVTLSAHEGNVDSVLVAGQFIKRSGALTRFDASTLLDDAKRSQQRLLDIRSALRRADRR